MDQLQKTRKMQIIAILVLYLEILNNFIMMVMLVCTYIIYDYTGHHKILTLVDGKDKGIEVDVEDSTDAVKVIDKERQEVLFMGNDVNIDEAPIDFGAESQLPPCLGDYFTDTGIGTSNCQNFASRVGEKRKRTRGTDCVIEQLVETMQVIGKVYESMKDDLDDLVGCFKREKEGRERRMQVFEELKKVEGLTDIERLKAGFKITKNQHAVDFFFTVDPELKLFYVKQILGANTL